MRFSVMVGNDVINNFFQPCRRFHQFININVLDLYVNFIGTISVSLHANRFNREFQNIFVPDSISNYIFVKALPEQFLGCLFTQLVFYGIFSKNGRACEAKHLDIPEE